MRQSPSLNRFISQTRMQRQRRFRFFEFGARNDSSMLNLFARAGKQKPRATANRRDNCLGGIGIAWLAIVGIN